MRARILEVRSLKMRQPGTRMPNKGPAWNEDMPNKGPAGGVNKEFYEGLKRARTTEERIKFEKERADEYVPRRMRLGPNDQEI